jgi:hypothetical protein
VIDGVFAVGEIQHGSAALRKQEACISASL